MREGRGGGGGGDEERVKEDEEDDLNVQLFLDFLFGQNSPVNPKQKQHKTNVTTFYKAWGFESHLCVYEYMWFVV